MIDFLRANPYVSKEEYMWKWTVPQIKLASYDFSHIEYLDNVDSNKKDNPKEQSFDNPMDFMKSFGLGMLNK